MIRTRTDGFTLIELMIVVGLISVLAAVSVPAIAAGMRRYSLITASQQVVSTIRAARLQAVGRNVTLRVRFNHPANRQYQVLDGRLCCLDAAVGAVKFLPSGAKFDSVSGDIEINTSGRVTPLAGDPTLATIVLSNEDDQTSTVTVSSRGRVRLP